MQVMLLSKSKSSKLLMNNAFLCQNRFFSSNINKTDRTKKVAIINGAYGGIGSAIARKMLDSGYAIGMLGRDETKLLKLKDTLESEYNRANAIKIYQSDLADKASLVRTAETLKNEFPRVDILINCAGHVPAGGILDVDYQVWEKTFSAYLFGVITLIKLLIPPMIEQQNGNIILINGVLSKQVDPALTVSSVLGGAINNFSKVISKELGEFGIKVNSINPGATDTQLWAKVVSDLAMRKKLTPDQINKNVIASTPLHRIATPDDIANVVKFLCSDEASFINGTSITVDGGNSYTF